MDQLSGLAAHQFGLVTLLFLFGLPLAWRSAGPPERASILALTGLACMDLLAWIWGGGAPLLHLAADAIALSWMVSVALRANRFYPAVIAAALLVAVLVQLLQQAGLARGQLAIAALINAMHLAAALAFLAGVLVQRHLLVRRAERPAWRDQSMHR